MVMRAFARAAALVAALLVVWQCRGVAAKKLDGELTLSSTVTEQYIAKFSFSSGIMGKINGDFLVSAAYLQQRPMWLLRSRQARFQSLQVAVYNQEAWDTYNKMVKTGSLCVERIQAATFQTLVPMSMPDDHDGTEDVPFDLGHQITPEENSHYWCVRALLLATPDCSNTTPLS